MDNIFEILKAHDLEGLKAFLTEYPRGMDVQAPDGAWALHEAMRQGDFDVAKYIVEYAIVNLNLTDSRGRTALHYGVESGNLALIRYLTERVSLSPLQSDLEGETPLETAVRLGKKEIKAYFEEFLGCPAEELYANPVCRGMHPDPSIVRVGEDYYMVNSTFMFFPCIPVSHSRDLIHWTVIGHAITNPEWARLKGLEGGRGYWAPDISYYEGRFYITATYRLNEGGMPQRLQMVTSSEKPEGPYCEPVFLDEDGIDPSIFTDLDGRRYMLLNRGARIFEISKDGRKILSAPKLLWYGDNKKASEGPHLLYKDGYYYLFMAEGGTGMGHRISVARSRTLMGVYENCPYNPILRQWDEKRLIQCSGHGMPVETQDGRWYMVYLCNRIGTAGYGIMGRETALDPITWTSDGWPVVNSLRGPSDRQRKPGFENRVMAYPHNDLWGEWMTVRGASEGSFDRTGENLVIRGNGRDLNTLEYGTVLLKAQKEFFFEVSARVSVRESAQEDWDTGLTCYYDENSYLKLALAKRGGKYGILTAEYVDDRYVTETFTVFSGQPGTDEGNTAASAELKIVSENLKRILYLKRGGLWEQQAVFENTSYLSSEGLKKGKRFTGAMAGIYVNGTVQAEFKMP